MVADINGSGGTAPFNGATERREREMSRSKRIDPYRNFKFRLSWNGRVVAGFNQSSGLDAVTPRAPGKGARVRKLPGLRKYTSITLKRGVTHDAKFVNWASKVSGSGRGRSTGKLNVTVMDERGKPIAVHKISRSWVSKFEALPELDANANAVAIESMTLEHQGRERDDAEAENKKFFGIYRGVVVNNVDPMQLGRIQVRVSAVSGEATLGWAMPCVPVNLPNTMASALPQNGGGVWIEFEGGDINHPVWIGCFWSGSEVPYALRNE